MGDLSTVTRRPAAASGGAQRRRLGRYANNSSPATPAPDAERQAKDAERLERKRYKRRERHSLRYRLRDLTRLKRVKDCGHVSINGEGSGPTLRLTAADKGGRVAGLSGLAHCGSVWACPVCAAKIATRRAEELADVMRVALDQGCSASMVTLTMRHHKGQTLADCWQALAAAWGAVTSGKQWTGDSSDLRGWVKAVEVTHGANGWHVHVHALLLWDKPVDHERADVIGERMWRRWTRSLRRHGFDSLRDSGGLDVRMATLKPGAGSGLHEYFTKLAHEIAGGQAKLAKGNGRTPFQLLTDALGLGLADDVERWWEWEKASKGRRQVAWSKGLREWANLGQEQSDEEIADEELDGADLVMLMPESWRELRHHPDRVCQLLEGAETGGFAGATSLLDSWGLRWQMGKAAPPWPARPVGSARLDVQRAEGLQRVSAEVWNRHRFSTLGVSDTTRPKF